MAFCVYKRRALVLHFTEHSSSTGTEANLVTDADNTMNSRIAFVLILVFMIAVPYSVLAQWECPFFYNCGKRQVCKANYRIN